MFLRIAPRVLNIWLSGIELASRDATRLGAIVSP